MEIFLGVICFVIFCIITYFIVKYAVKNAIIEAHRDINGLNATVEIYKSGIAQKTCTQCKKQHDIDYPKCPFCGYHSSN